MEVGIRGVGGGGYQRCRWRWASEVSVEVGIRGVGGGGHHAEV